MAIKQRIEFGNFTLKFGEEKVMLDLFEEIVWPAFESLRYVRSIQGRGQFFFLDTKIVELRSKDSDRVAPAVIGRIVKNTKLKRDQIFSDGEIVPDTQELATAPSSVFVLLLENHRLLLCREVTGAPTIQNFESTCKAFFKLTYRKFVEELVKEVEAELGERAPRGTYSKIVTENPGPRLRITPLADTESLSEFVGRFSKVEELVIKLLPTNKEEIDNDDFWCDFDRRREEMNSSSASVRFANSGDGLDPRSIIAQASSAAGMGNSEVVLRGKDSEGDKIRGNNEDFNLVVEIDPLPKAVLTAATRLFKRFAKLADSGVIKLPKTPKDIANKVQSLVSGLK